MDQLQKNNFTDIQAEWINIYCIWQILQILKPIFLCEFICETALNDVSYSI